MRNFERVRQKVAETEFFLEMLENCGPDPFAAQCYLGAFAAAARSVTYALQVSLAGVPGFAEWYETERGRLREDRGAQWFHALRNANQHQGTWNITSGLTHTAENGQQVVRHWAVATEDANREFDVVEACRRHHELLGDLVQRATVRLPKAADPAWIFNEDHLAQEGMTVEDLEEALGFPRAWTDTDRGSVSDRLRALARHA